MLLTDGWTDWCTDDGDSYKPLSASPKGIDKEQVGVYKALIRSMYTSNRACKVLRERCSSFIQPLAGFAHSNQVLELLVVMLILFLSCGIWALNGFNQQENHLWHITFIWILLQMLQLKCGNPSKIHLINWYKNRYICIKNSFKDY